MDYLQKITVIVHSCDSYSDLWEPFFTLFKKYWPYLGCRIILNTETKDFSMEGLNIECMHPKRKDSPYGKRLKEAVSHITTPYCLTLLDDFFLRSFVNLKEIEEIISYMDADSDIACFNFENTPLYYESYENGAYKGFHRMPPGNEYILNMQAAVWRTQKYNEYWRNNVSPWEWEEICNVSVKGKDKFYCREGSCPSIILDYGHYIYGDVWGVYRGKWVEKDISPLFEKEGININLESRGVYIEGRDIQKLTLFNVYGKMYRIIRCLGLIYFIKYLIFRMKSNGDYYYYILNKKRKSFLKCNNLKQE